MPTVFGIDPSSKKLAIAATRTFNPHEIPQLDVIRLPAGVHRATGAAYREVFYFLQSIQDAVVYLEAPVVGINPQSTIVQAQVGGAVLAAAQHAGMPMYLVNNNSWKKQVLGKGNLRKEQIASALREIWPEAYDACQGDQDLIDACAINRFGVGNQRLAMAIRNRSRSAREKADGEKAGGTWAA